MRTSSRFTTTSTGLCFTLSISQSAEILTAPFVTPLWWQSHAASVSLCFIYLLVFLHVVVLSLTLYCTQSTTMVLARSHGLLPPASCFMVNKQGKAWLKTGPDDPLEGSSCYTNFTLNWKGNVCWENVPWHNTVMWGKKKKNMLCNHCFTLLI